MTNPNSLWGRLGAQLLRTGRALKASVKTFLVKLISEPRPKVLVFVEGPHAVEFLCRIAAILHDDDAKLPDLAAMERRRELVFVPFGGGDPRLWPLRMAGLGAPEFHLYDREEPPETDFRQQAADVVNWRPGCQAVLTNKRNLENYLHPDAVFEASGIRVVFGDTVHVAELVAKTHYEQNPEHVPWENLPPRARKKRRARVKRWLNTRGVERMTLERLAERDPQGEVRAWLTTIARLAKSSV
jgi:hypothetical protein